jgi:hypothetical protein
MCDQRIQFFRISGLTSGLIPFETIVVRREGYPSLCSWTILTADSRCGWVFVVLCHKHHPSNDLNDLPRVHISY